MNSGAWWCCSCWVEIRCDKMMSQSSLGVIKHPPITMIYRLSHQRRRWISCLFFIQVSVVTVVHLVKNKMYLELRCISLISHGDEFKERIPVNNVSSFVELCCHGDRALFSLSHTHGMCNIWAILYFNPNICICIHAPTTKLSSASHTHTHTRR